MMLIVLALIAIAMYAAAWQSLFGPSGRKEDVEVWWIVAVSMAFTYQAGYRNVLKNLGPLVFVLALLLPTTLQLIGVAIRLVRIYS
ncbi:MULTISPECIES: hypothetical protein [Lysobacter]|nr:MULTISPECIES: hypothetical protein [Lysobacter]QCW25542.1 hypothetical protein FE772_07575 [Lysobacter enzymogenes]QQP99937.1 hypothetical protein JHW41_17730 [Lysobacter enzymogenes]UZW59382.1 hypothetical protein BV903_019055 [Lysobacter enzymogenes]WMT03161.1 hypothetical protein RDV84_24935 [Lysobacter yananisis]